MDMGLVLIGESMRRWSQILNVLLLKDVRQGIDVDCRERCKRLAEDVMCVVLQETEMSLLQEVCKGYTNIRLS